MYYENLLRGLHQNLYQKEQEVKQMKDQLKNAQVNAMVEVQCQLANHGHDLIMGELCKCVRIAVVIGVSVAASQSQ